MNILMMTNTYKPILGGLEKSVESFSAEFRKRGHRVKIVAPVYKGAEPETDVIRIPAVQKFNGSDFSVQLPIPGILEDALGDFKPDVIHTHHPFLIGDTALRLATKYNVPLVFTHHTLYEENVHYLPGNESGLKQFVIELSTGYANLADQVIAPSQSVEKLIRERGVLDSPIAVIPTGIWTNEYARGARQAFRKKLGISPEAYVVGHLGRLAAEKNLNFLSEAVMLFLKKNPDAYFLVVGKGPLEETMKEMAQTSGVLAQVCFAGPQSGKDKVDAYHAMDVFAFASQSETQGLVITEAVASKVPVVAVDAPGVREVVQDKVNGRLLAAENVDDFVHALNWMKCRTPEELKDIQNACRETAKEFDMDVTATKALALYTSLVVRQGFIRRQSENSKWTQTIRMLQTQGGLVKNLTKAATAMVATVFHGQEKNESL